MKTIHESRNELLKRKEFVVEITLASNPGSAHATKLISDHYKVAEDVVIVKKLRNVYGSHSLMINAFIYDSKEAKDKIEPRKKEKRVAA
jgi:ribosomal protein S24E